LRVVYSISARYGFISVPIPTDFDIRWNPRSRIMQPGADRVTIFDAIDKQLGLKLELQQIPAPVVAVDHVNQKPVANPAEATQVLTPRSLEFEVASIKLSPPDERFGLGRYPGGRVELHAFPMRMLISTAFSCLLVCYDLGSAYHK
jgi:hypothetical protein